MKVRWTVYCLTSSVLGVLITLSLLVGAFDESWSIGARVASPTAEDETSLMDGREQVTGLSPEAGKGEEWGSVTFEGREFCDGSLLGWEVPGDCGWPAVHLSPGLLKGGWVAWCYNMKENNSAVNEIVAVRIGFVSDEMCLACTRPEVGLKGKTVGLWWDLWKLPYGEQSGPLFTVDGPILLDRYVTDAGNISWRVKTGPANNTCVWQTTLEYRYTVIPWIKLVVQNEDPGTPTCPGLAFIGKGEEYTYKLKVVDQYNEPVKGATITILDGVSVSDDGSPEPEVIELGSTDYKFNYTITGGLPDTNKLLTMTPYKAGYNNAANQTLTKKISVTGRYWLEDTHSTILPRPTPLVVLYDPPGDASYAYLEQYRSFYGGLGMSVEREDGKQYILHGGIGLGPLFFNIDPEITMTVTTRSAYDYEWEIVSGMHLETSSDDNPEILGPGSGSHFLASGGMKLLYGKAWEVAIDSSVTPCVATADSVISFEFDPDQSGVETFWGSAWEIENVVMPPEPDSLKEIWQQLLEYNISSDNTIDSKDTTRLVCGPAGHPVHVDRFWGGGSGPEEHFSETTIGHRFEMSFKQTVDYRLAVEFGFEILDSLDIGGNAKAVVWTTLAVGGYFNIGTERTNRIGYVLCDDDGYDQFGTRVFFDKTYGTPVFINLGGTCTRCPWEQFTDPNEIIQLVNTDGIQDLTVCPDTHAVVHHQVEFASSGLLGGAPIRIHAPIELNECNALVTINNQSGPFVVPVDTSVPYQITTRISPDCNCSSGVNQLVIRAESACDPRIHSDDTIRVHCDYSLCPDILIVSPADGAVVSSGVTIIARTRGEAIDGVLFLVRERYQSHYDTLCFDTQPDSAESAYDYSCVWYTDSWESNKYYRILVEKFKNGIPGGQPDSIEVFVDNMCPYVLEFTPEDEGLYAGEISASFSEDLDGTTVNSTSFTLYDSTSLQGIPCHTVSYYQDIRKARFWPQDGLPCNHRYTATLTRDMRDIAGHRLCQDTSWSFTARNVIHAESQVIDGIPVSDVVIGVDNSSAGTVPDPGPPPQYSVHMRLYRTDGSGPFCRDIREVPASPYDTLKWVIAINPHGNVSGTGTATISWDPSQFEDANYLMWEGSGKRGPILIIEDMSQTATYQAQGASEYYYFTIVGTGYEGTWVAEDGHRVPLTFALHQSYPNPFNPIATIGYDISKPSYVRLVVYNTLGQRIRTLVNEERSAGHHMVQWDGTDEHGNPVASGLYFYRMQSEEFTETRKLIMLK